MKKRLFTIVAIGCVGLSVLFGCGNSDNSGDSQEEENQVYFQIAEDINNADYDTAWNELQDAYGSVDYSDTYDGFNKMNLYRLYYIKLEKYDDAMDVMLEYLGSYDFKTILESEDEDDAFDKENVKYVIGQVYDILDSVSEDKKQAAIDLIGQETLEQYKEGMGS
jgi:hypothetical protein